MILISFGVGIVIGSIVGGSTMALITVAGRASEGERVGAAYRNGRNHERQALTLPDLDDHSRPTVTLNRLWE